MAARIIVPLEAVIVDMDGVLVDSEEQWRLAERPLFESLVPGWKEEDHGRIVGLGVQDLHRFFVREYGLRQGLETFMSSCDRVAEEVYGRRVRLLPGARKLLGALASKGLPLGLATSSPRRWTDMVLERFGLKTAFNAIVTADDVAGEGKPSPAIYIRAAKLLGKSPAACAAVEDSAVGVMAAKRAGMKCVAVRNGSNDEQDLSGADLEVRGLPALTLERLRLLFRTSSAPRSRSRSTPRRRA